MTLSHHCLGAPETLNVWLCLAQKYYTALVLQIATCPLKAVICWKLWKSTSTCSCPPSLLPHHSVPLSEPCVSSMLDYVRAYTGFMMLPHHLPHVTSFKAWFTQRRSHDPSYSGNWGLSEGFAGETAYWGTAKESIRGFGGLPRERVTLLWMDNVGGVSVKNLWDVSLIGVWPAAILSSL